MTAQLNIGDQAPTFLLTDQNGNQVELEQLWANGPTLLTFLRHFG
ncbi:MAG: hypothetical protein SF029_17260 [bacterium]|nr:hypothetical protein [bacterium]